MEFTYRKREIRRVGLFGYGESTRGIYSYLSSRYPTLSFTLRDERIKEIPNGFLKVYTGELATKEISEDILFLSPSVRKDRSVFQEAALRGVLLSSDCEFFFENTKSDIFAISGSDGKSTTARLTSMLLGCEAIGNMGRAMTPYAEEEGRLVCELSSFQLFSLAPKTKRAYITNVTKNHLDWHKSFSEYAGAKENILKNAEEPIINYDCPICREYARRYQPYAVISLRMPYKELRKRVRAEVYVTSEEGYVDICGERILPTEEIRLKGTYNLYNLLGAIALSNGYCEASDIIHAAREFGGLPHRFELIHEKNGVKYVDSSIDSTPMRTLATLSRSRDDTVLILGGRSKNLSYLPLANGMPKNVVTVIAVGENSSEIERDFNNSESFLKSGVPFFRFDDFYTGVFFAIKNAKKSQTVLLSPASTSYDKFKNYEERGLAFKDFVKKITD